MEKIVLTPEEEALFYLTKQRILKMLKYFEGEGFTPHEIYVTCLSLVVHVEDYMDGKFKSKTD